MKSDKVIERVELTKDQAWIRGFNTSIYKHILPYIKRRSILDAGCGNGLFEVICLDLNIKKIDAFDISASALLNARKLVENKSSKIMFGRKDFNQEGFKKSAYDIAVSTEVIEHLTNYQFYLGNLYRALKQGGKLFLSTPNKNVSPELNRYHVQEFSFQEMMTNLESANFKVIKTYGIAPNNLSNFVTKFVSGWVIYLVKKLPGYEWLISRFFQFKTSSPENSSTILYVAKK